MTVDEAIDEDARRTSAFARRQRTWFRGEPDITWLIASTDPYRSARALVDAFLDVASAAPALS